MSLKCSMVYSNVSSPVASWSEAIVALDHVRAVNGQFHPWPLSTRSSQQAPQGAFTLAKTVEGLQLEVISINSLFPQLPSDMDSLTVYLQQTSECLPHSWLQAWLYEWHPHTQRFLQSQVDIHLFKPVDRNLPNAWTL